MNYILKLFALFMLLFSGLLQAAPTDFSSALPTTLIPDGFWSLTALALALVVAIAGVSIAI